MGERADRLAKNSSSVAVFPLLSTACCHRRYRAAPQDPQIRSKMSVPLEGSVVILDEAHNAEGVCRDAGSLELSVLDLAGVAAALCLWTVLDEIGCDRTREGRVIR